MAPTPPNVAATQLPPAFVPTLVDIVLRVASPNSLKGPVTGQRAALVGLELVELCRGVDGPQAPAVVDEVPVGVVTIGDVLELQSDDGASVVLVPRRARISFQDRGEAAAPIDAVPVELAPLLPGASGRGILAVREHRLLAGDHVRLRAVVERAVVPGSDTAMRFFVRDERGPIEIHALGPW